MITSLDQAMIDAMLADSRFTSRFPELAEARTKLVRAGSSSAPSCCGGAKPQQQAQNIRQVYSWLKRTVANWPQETKTAFLTAIGQQNLQIAYNDQGVVRTVLITR